MATAATAAVLAGFLGPDVVPARAVVFPSLGPVSTELIRGEACSPNSTNGLAVASIECIAGTARKTRNLNLNHECVSGPKADALFQAGVYPPHRCGSVGKGAEAIAQARYIYKHNRQEQQKHITLGVSPGIHWELSLPDGRKTRRGDVVEYDYRATGPEPRSIDILEAKGTWRGTIADAQNQARGYVTLFQNSQKDPRYQARPSKSHLGYGDTFKILLDHCPDGTELYTRYEVDGPADGALMVNPTESREDCDEDANLNVDTQWLGQDFDDWPRAFPIIVPLLGTIGPAPSTPLWQRTSPLGRFSDLVQSVLSGASCLWLCVGSDGVRTPDGSLDASSSVIVDWITSQSIAASSGDPHLTSLDGTAFDIQSVGEFDLVQSAQDDVPYDFRVQTRFKGLPGGRVSTTDAVAFVLNGTKVVLSSSGVLVDGTAMDVSDGSYIYFGAGAAVFRSGSTYAAIWPGQTDRPMLTFGSSTVRIHVPSFIATRGLLGNNNSTKGDDFVTRGGWDLGSNPGAAALHGSFAESWRITDASSIFSYKPGESTATFTDSTYPTNLFKISDYSPDVITAAQNSCLQATVPEGPALSGCISDVILSGDAPTFTAIAAKVDNPGSSLVGSKVFDADGRLAEDFENPVAPNFDPYKLSTDPATSTIAGPLSGDRPYAFSVADMPAHNSLDISFDLLTLGTWTGVSSSASFNVDGRSVWSSSLSTVSNATPAGTGTLASGGQYAKYRVTINLPHTASTLKGSLTTSGLSSTASRAIGIDNIEVVEQLVPPQTFVLPLDGSMVRDGVPGAGAGNLENKSSNDTYSFNVPDGGKSLFLDFQSCTNNNANQYLNGLLWKVVQESTGAKIEGDYCGSGNKTVALTAGDYRLEMTGDPTRDSWGTYSLTTFFVPDPQVFALPLDGSVVSDGVPAAGAGNLETKGSKDAYALTVPEGGKSLFIDFRTCASNTANQYLNGLMWQLTSTATGTKIAGDYCASGNKTITLPAGDYRLEMTSDISRNSLGAYSMVAFFVPDPQVFALPLDGSVVSDGVPAAGAGNLETKGSKDAYALTVPEGGKSLFFDFRTCASNNANQYVNGLMWQVTAVATGAKIAGDYCASGNKTGTLPAGDYRLEMTTDITRKSWGTYSLAAFFVPDPQSFALPVDGKVVTDGVPAAGAGNLETKTSSDSYTFSVPDGGKNLFLDFKACTNNNANQYLNGLMWKIVFVPTDEKMAGDYCSSGNKTVALPAGDYRLELTTDITRNSWGTYSLAAFFVPDPQVFALPVDGSTISDGTPAAGAGNLETKGSKDTYTFTVPEGGRSLFVDFITCVSNNGNQYLNGLMWQVTAAATGAKIAGDYCSSGNKTVALPAGDYRLELTTDITRNSWGTYSLAAFFVPDPQVFALPVDGSTISDGTPAAGAGNLET
ncbi:VWD domain-containing protein, partial [Arthrobacter sp. NPDC093139]|uniref:VWD domain-containing protein n=1 Tax=Arthrobacter sp. NPDC093139 TaxID=3363945 RepID=UPI00380CFEC3